LQLAIDNKLNWKERRNQKISSLSLSAIEAEMSFKTAKALVQQKVGNHYPAPLMAIKAIEEAKNHTRDTALNIERTHFMTLIKGSESRAMVGLFLSDQYVKSKVKKVLKSTITSPKHVSIVGAGIMGGGIAYQAASKGFHVSIQDIQKSSLDLGLTEASKLLNKQLSRKKISGMELSATLNHMTPTLNISDISNSDVIIEAVTENPKIKSSVLQDIEKHCDSNTVITSNTSTIPISTLSKSLQDPTRFCGMHFFNPVHRMPLVEVIRSTYTTEETINTVVSLASKLGKSPIVVNDCPGFFVNRVLFPYFSAFCLLLHDGEDIKTIDKTMEEGFGWPMGPAYLLDVVGLDTAYHAQKVMEDGYPTRMLPLHNNPIDNLFKSNLFGQKNSTGFYQYTEDKKGKPIKSFDNAIYQTLKLNVPTKKSNESIIIERMMIPMINEVLHCLQENIINSPEEADMALIYGLGFPPFKGGVCRYLDEIGLEEYLDMTLRHQHLGPLYHAPIIIQNMINEGKNFYDSQINQQ
ncbi:3-hydroxyacyl-CoA dehydrogenase NAD-binding domain-containing protein, partial [Vibrio sp.]|nr:3-hydroxyacyl-CoA dehydrogenase NAD-binding domain-containing protein [Vibrio sp.]